MSSCSISIPVDRTMSSRRLTLLKLAALVAAASASALPASASSLLKTLFPAFLKKSKIAKGYDFGTCLLMEGMLLSNPLHVFSLLENFRRRKDYKTISVYVRLDSSCIISLSFV